MSRYPQCQLVDDHNNQLAEALLACVDWPEDEEDWRWQVFERLAEILVVRGLAARNHRQLGPTLFKHIGYRPTHIGYEYIEEIRAANEGRYRFRSLDADWVRL